MPSAGEARHEPVVAASCRRRSWPSRSSSPPAPGCPRAGRSTRATTRTRTSRRRTSRSCRTTRSRGRPPRRSSRASSARGPVPGITGDWERAREFLAPDIRSSWKPTAGVTIDLSSDRVYSSTAEDSVSLSLVAVATVDANGAYERDRRGPDVAAVRARQAGRRRVADHRGARRHRARPRRLPERLRRLLGHVLRPDVGVSRARRAVVPHGQRRLARRRRPRQQAARATGSRTRSRRRSRESVTVVAVGAGRIAGVAEVDLSDSALAVPPETLDRMLTQLEASLGTAGATDVVLSVGGAPISAEPVPVRSTRVTGPSLVLTEAGFGFLVGDELEPIPGLTEVIEHRVPGRDPGHGRAGLGGAPADRRHRRPPGRGRLVRPARHPARAHRSDDRPVQHRVERAALAADRAHRVPAGRHRRSRSPTRGREPPRSRRWRCRGTAPASPRS